MRTIALSLVATAMAWMLFGGVGLSQDETPPPTQMGFVDVQEVFANYWRREQVEQTLDSRFEALKGRIEAQVERLGELADELETLNRESPEFEARRKDLVVLEYSIEYDKESGREALLAEQVRQRGLLYKDIVKEIQAYGESNGFAAVLVDSPLPDTFEELPENQQDQAMATRSVLWSDDRRSRSAFSSLSIRLLSVSMCFLWS